MKNENRKECGKRFRAIRRMAINFAERVDFSPASIKGLKEMQFSCGDDFACTTTEITKLPEAHNRIVRGQILTALVYATTLIPGRVGLSFDDIETLTTGKGLVLNFTFGFDTKEER